MLNSGSISQGALLLLIIAMMLCSELAFYHCQGLGLDRAGTRGRKNWSCSHLGYFITLPCWECGKH